MGFSNGGGGSAAITGIAQGLAANRPPAANFPPGGLYFATDSGELTINNLAQTLFQVIATITSNLLINGTLNLQSGAAIAGGGSLLQINRSLDLTQVGKGLQVAEGPNAKQGTYGPLVAGTLTVANTSITASSRILATRSPGGANPGAHMVTTQTAGTSFVITSTSATDTGNGVFLANEPG